MSTVTDSFTRADEFPLAAPWTNGGEVEFDLSGNKAVPGAFGSDCAAIYNGTGAPAWGNDHYSQGDLTVNGSAGGSQGIGLWVRHAAGSTKTGYRFVVDHAASNNCEIQKFVTGTYSSVQFATVASWTDGDTWKFLIQGTTLTVYRNSSLVMTATDSAVSSGSPGMGFSSSETSASVVNWVGSDDLTTATPVQVYIPHRMPLGA